MRILPPIPLLLAACGLALAACGGADAPRAEKGCDDGDAAACSLLGRLRLSGAAGPKDRKGGRLAFERACELGDAASCGMAGSLVYARRDGQARYWLKRGCDLGHARSCTTLGWMLGHGEGGDVDLPGASAAFDKGCRGGEAAACVFAALALPAEDAPGANEAARARAALLDRACALGDRLSCGREGGR